MDIKAKIILIILIVVAFIVVSIYFVYQKFYFSWLVEKTSKSTQEKPIEIVKPEPGKSSTEIKLPAPMPSAPMILAGYKLHKNAEFGFEIQYPETWIVAVENNENVRGEVVKEFYFKNPNSDLRFAILPRDGLSYGLGAKGTSTPIYMGGFTGMQTQYILKDGRRLWLLFPRYGLYNWLEDLGRIDAMTSVENPDGDTKIFEKMLNSFKLAK